LSISVKISNGETSSFLSEIAVILVSTAEEEARKAVFVVGGFLFF
jgi:hypothetical protein